MSAAPVAGFGLRGHYQRQVLHRPWLAFIVLGLAFFAFAVSGVNLVHLISANVGFLVDNGWMAVLDGGASQFLGLLLNGYGAMLAYVVLKSCEHAIVDWLSGTRVHVDEAPLDAGGSH